MSAPKDEQGRYQIDPAELFRVYPLTVPEPETKPEADPTPTTTETALLREKTANLERIITTLEDERDDLRRRLDRAEEARENTAAECRRLTLLLTHQPANQNTPPTVRPALWGALVAASTAAALAFCWPWLTPKD